MSHRGKEFGFAHMLHHRISELLVLGFAIVTILLLCGEGNGEQGATLHEIMVYLKKWLPYGTTGNANPEDGRVTGVVREHIRVLEKNKYIKMLGDRYFFRSYQPALPTDVYSPKIDWNSVLHDENLKLKGETVCHIISTIYEHEHDGMRNKELAGILDMSPYALHYHIKKLENLNIIEKRKGKGKRYFPNFHVMQAHISS